MSTLPCKRLLLVLVVALGACGGDSHYLGGENVSGLKFQFYRDDEGIHPSTVTLSNPHNPFRFDVVGDDTKWEILTAGGNAGAFYAWATLLARGPNGENQYYTATKLRDIYNAHEVDAAHSDTVRQMAIDGFQAVLDYFPDSVTYDASGTQTFRLATPALLGILDLNGDVKGDWVLVTDQNGSLVAIKGSGATSVPLGGVS